MHDLGCFDVKIRDNEEQVRRFVERHPESLMYASLRLQLSKEFIADLLVSYPGVLPWIHVNFRDNFEFMTFAKSFIKDADKYMTQSLRTRIASLSPLPKS